MTRRLTLALLASVLVTLLVAGAVTVAIARWQASASTEERVREQAESLAGLADLRPGPQAEEDVAQITRRVLGRLRQTLSVEGIELVVIGEAGRVRGTMPDGADVADLDIEALRAGTTVSGRGDGGLVWAAAPYPLNTVVAVTVVTTTARTDLTDVVPWFLVAAAVTLVTGAVVAWLLGRRLARPVRAAGAAAQHIAAGDLSTRLPEDGTGGDELSALSRSINTMAASLERARDRDRQFLLSISHDLRTPLTSIRGYADAIVDGTAPDAKGAATVVAAQADRLERLVADLLLLARLDAGSFAIHVEVVELEGPVRSAVQAFAPLAEAAGLRIEIVDPPRTAAALIDADRLEQLLGNLLANATRFARTHVAVTVVADGDRWIVRVDDDGPGIAPAERLRVLERLATVTRPGERDRQPAAGVGLGLAIVDQLVQAMGGSVVIGEAPSGGARVDVRLPAATVVAALTVP